MGTKKTRKLLGWLDPSDAKQARWALGVLRKEHAEVGLLRSRVSPVFEHNLESWLHALRTQLDESQTEAEANDNAERAQAARRELRHLKILDANMRHAWGERRRRADPNTKGYSFRMHKSVQAKLGTLRSRWNKPIYEIVQVLIEDAYFANKLEREIEQAPKRAAARKKRASTHLLKLRHEQKQSEREIDALRGIVRELAQQLLEAEYRDEHELPADALLSPSAMIDIREKSKKAAAAYFARAEAAREAVPKPQELSAEDQAEVGGLE